MSAAQVAELAKSLATGRETRKKALEVIKSSSTWKQDWKKEERQRQEKH